MTNQISQVVRSAKGCSIALLAALLVLIGSQTMAGTQQLAGSEWRPLEIAGELIPADASMFIRFEADGKVRGHGGCNALFGAYKIDKVTLRIGPLAATRKACQSEVMSKEGRFVAALEKSRIYLRDAAKLTLKDAQGVTTMRLIQTDFD